MHQDVALRLNVDEHTTDARNVAEALARVQDTLSSRSIREAGDLVILVHSALPRATLYQAGLRALGRTFPALELPRTPPLESLPQLGWTPVACRRALQALLVSMAEIEQRIGLYV
jgi:hypothetical protein